MATVFSDMLCRLRGEAGFPTAYRFYHDNGGKAVMKMSYRNYLLIEQGKSLPEASRLNKLSNALRLTPKSAAAAELAVAWLRTLAGEETFENVFKHALSAAKPQPVMSPMDKAANRAISDKKFFITPEHYKVIVASFENYLCFLAMSNDAGVWETGALAETLKLGKAVTEKALAALEKAGLMKKAGPGRWRCPLATALVEAPPLNTLDESLKKIEAFNAQLLKAGSTIWHRGGIIRINEGDLRNLTPLMANNISASKLYATTNRTEDSALFFIEGKILKLCKF
ncbi:MAG: hypothetical protein WCK76_01465 [Elusimicrobiota bacterium]